MRKLAFGILFVTFATPALALPAHPWSAAPVATQGVIEVKRGHGHGWGRGHGHGRGWGWSRGRKIGWRGLHCPPGLWKQGRC